MCEDVCDATGSSAPWLCLLVIHFSNRVEISWGLFLQIARKTFSLRGSWLFSSVDVAVFFLPTNLRSFNVEPMWNKFTPEWKMTCPSLGLNLGPFDSKADVEPMWNKFTPEFEKWLVLCWDWTWVPSIQKQMSSLCEINSRPSLKNDLSFDGIEPGSLLPKADVLPLS